MYEETHHVFVQNENETALELDHFIFIEDD